MLDLILLCNNFEEASKWKPKRNYLETFRIFKDSFSKELQQRKFSLLKISKESEIRNLDGTTTYSSWKLFFQNFKNLSQNTHTHIYITNDNLIIVGAWMKNEREIEDRHLRWLVGGWWFLQASWSKLQDMNNDKGPPELFRERLSNDQVSDWKC